MFAADEVPLDLSFGAAAARLAEVARTGLLTRVSQGTCGEGVTGLVRVGPLGAAPGCPSWPGCICWTCRSAVSPPSCRCGGRRPGPGGALFPALDADLALTPAGEHVTRLSLAGAYRPPLGPVGAGLDQAVFHKVAQATVRSLLARVADTLTRPPGPADGEAQVVVAGVGPQPRKGAGPGGSSPWKFVSQFRCVDQPGQAWFCHGREQQQTGVVTRQ
jgi:hypothetical protein